METRLRLVNVSSTEVNRANTEINHGVPWRATKHKVAMGKSRVDMVRWIARWWDLVGVLALLGASAACGVFSLTHLGR